MRYDVVGVLCGRIVPDYVVKADLQVDDQENLQGSV